MSAYNDSYRVVAVAACRTMRAQELLVDAGCVRPPRVLVGLLAHALGRRETLKDQGLPGEAAERVAIDELDLRSPQTLGPLIVEMPGLQGRLRDIEAQLREVLLEAMAR